ILAPGEQDTLHVVVPTQNGRLVSPLALSWQTSNPAVFQVNLVGAVRAVGPGVATLTVGGLLQTKTLEIRVHRAVEAFAVLPRASAEVAVPVTATARFQATPLAGDNSPVPEARVTWSLSDTSVAGFDPATGTLTARKLGRTQLVARGPGREVPPLLDRAIQPVAVAARLGRHRPTDRSGVLAGRLAHRLRLQPRRQRRDLRDGRGRHQRHAAHQRPAAGRPPRLCAGRPGDLVPVAARR